MSADLQVAISNRDIAFRAYQKALMSSHRYEVEGMSLQRYQLDELRGEYIFWRDQVDHMLTYGNNSTMTYRRIIPVDY